MHLTILRKILERVKQYAASKHMPYPLSEMLDEPLQYGYGTGDAGFDFLIDTLEEMEKEAKHLDLITPPGHE